MQLIEAALRDGRSLSDWPIVDARLEDKSGAPWAAVVITPVTSWRYAANERKIRSYVVAAVSLREIETIWGLSQNICAIILNLEYRVHCVIFRYKMIPLEYDYIRKRGIRLS